MPKLPTDYSKTVIYIIKCKDNNITEEYIGSTTNFKIRKANHKNACNNEKDKCYNLKVYKYIRENGGWNNWSMIELEKYSCNDKREAEKREEEIRIDRKAKLNMIKAFCTRKQYYEEHKEYYKELNKKYREENKEEIIINKKNYYEENKEEINNKRKNKEWICPICNKEMRDDSRLRHNKTIHLEENKISI